MLMLATTSAPPAAPAAPAFTTCGMRSPHFAETREVQTSSGSEMCVSTSMTWMRSVMAEVTASCFPAPTAESPRRGRSAQS